VLGAEAFDQVGLKADLGALILGVMLAKHGRAGEISDSLLNFKEILLVGSREKIGSICSKSDAGYNAARVSHLQIGPIGQVMALVDIAHRAQGRAAPV
jgi:hypothetical protein